MKKKAVKKLDHATCCQIGFVVKDVEKVSRAFAKLFGIPAPKCGMSDGYDKAHTKYKGKPTKARCKMAFLPIGEKFNIELIQPVGGPSTWKDHLKTKGEGVHHLGFVVKDTAAHLKMLRSKGIRVVHNGEFQGGTYTYVDSLKDLKLIMELVEVF